MDQLPVFIRLQNRPCLVVGGGVVAERKVKLLRRAGAAVTIVAPQLSDTLTEWLDDGYVAHRSDEFHASMLDGMQLVIAATDNDVVNHRIAEVADAAGILCNVVDDGEASSFIVPAIIDRSPVVVAIGTGGNAPVLAQWLKTRIEAWLPTRIGALARQAGRWRGLVKKRFSTLDERRRFWQRFFNGPIAQHLLANRTRTAEQLLRRELIEDAAADNRPSGEAWIVGAGPGDPGLLTLRAQQCIAQADVVLYDRLVSPAVIDFARKDAQFVSVGKTPNRQGITQEKINELIVTHVKAGRRVCRLKGGDPFVFGRGGEEALALAAAQLPFEIVPGISAALGCAAYAGIPLTHRGVSHSVTFMTAKLDGGSAPDLGRFAGGEHTLVLYMGVSSLAKTAMTLRQSGLSADMPVAIVENGTSSAQRVVSGTLATIANAATSAKLGSPALIIIGNTAKLADTLAWFRPQGANAIDDSVPAAQDRCDRPGFAV